MSKGEGNTDVNGGALKGYKVIDFGQMVSAPFCAKLFSDFGADVIKVEPPDGDASRRMGPFPRDEPHLEKSGLFFINNTNKRGVTCDVVTDEGRTLFLRLVQRADILIENNLPAQMKAWGLTYDVLAETNPNLVVISITPFGQTGPYSGWNGYDLNAYHLSGASSRYCGRPDDSARCEHGTFAADYLRRRNRCRLGTWGRSTVVTRPGVGTGQQIDVSCAEAIAATFVGAPRTLGGWLRTAPLTHAPVSGCRWAPRRRSSLARTGMYGCSRWNRGSGMA